MTDTPVGTDADPADLAGTEPILPGIELPSVGSGRRSHRRQEKSRRQRRRTGITVAFFVILASLGGAAVILVPRLLDGGDDPVVTANDPGETLPVVDVEPGPKGLFLQIDRANRLVAVTIALAALDGGGGVVFAPTTTLTDVPNFGLETLGDAYRLGGADLVDLTMENLLGVSFDHVAVLDNRSWGQLAEGIEVIELDNPRAVEFDDDGIIRIARPAGPTALSPDEVGEFLAERSVGEPDLVRLLRHDVLWREFLSGFSGIDRAVSDPFTNLVGFVDLLAEGSVDYRLLPVETLSGSGPDTEYAVDRASVDDMMTELAPETLLTALTRVRVRLLNGVGTPGLAAVATELLVPAGARIDVRDNAQDFDYEVTQIIYYRDDQLPAAERLRDALGLGEVLKDRNTIDVVDVTVLLGADFVAEYVS